MTLCYCDHTDAELNEIASLDAENIIETNQRIKMENRELEKITFSRPLDMNLITKTTKGEQE